MRSASSCNALGVEPVLGLLELVVQYGLHLAKGTLTFPYVNIDSGTMTTETCSFYQPCLYTGRPVVRVLAPCVHCLLTEQTQNASTHALASLDLRVKSAEERMCVRRSAKCHDPKSFSSTHGHAAGGCLTV